MLRRARGLALAGSILVPALALALAGGCGKGIWYEYTEGFKYVEPFDHIVVDVDRGSLTFVAWARPDATLKRHTSGFDKEFGPADAEVEDGTLLLTGACKTDDKCWYDHMLEFSTGISVDITMKLGFVEIGYVDRTLTANIEEGRFYGAQLAADVEVSLGTGDIDVELVVPAGVDLATGTGDITLTVPAGTYRCDFAVPGDPDVEGVTCDPAAATVLAVSIDDGSLSVEGVTP